MVHWFGISTLSLWVTHSALNSAIYRQRSMKLRLLNKWRSVLLFYQKPGFLHHPPWNILKIKQQTYPAFTSLAHTDMPRAMFPHGAYISYKSDRLPIYKVPLCLCIMQSDMRMSLCKGHLKWFWWFNLWDEKLGALIVDFYWNRISFISHTTWI